MKLKKLYETRAAKMEEIKAIIDAADAETRSLNDDEVTKFNAIKAEVENIDATITAMEEARSLEKVETKEVKEDTETRSAEDIFNDYVKGVEVRAGEMSTTTDGNIIPNELSSDIIRKVTEKSGIFSKVKKVNSTGTYTQIKQGNKVSAGWTDELAEVTSSTASFDTVEIGHNKLGALAKISYELINQASFNITSEVEAQSVDALADKIEDAIYNGDGVKKPVGLISGGTSYNLAADAVTADDLVKILHELKAPYQNGAEWHMNRKTLCAIRLLKDENGQFLFHAAELSSGFAGYVLGKPVVISEKIADNVIFYGDFAKAYTVNANPSMSVQVLREKYATQGMIGVLSFAYLDGKVVNDEAYVVAKYTA